MILLFFEKIWRKLLSMNLLVHCNVIKDKAVRVIKGDAERSN